MQVRLQKFIARTGLASRRKAETLITAGRVQVNGAVVTKLGTTIDPSRDVVSLNGKTVMPPAEFRYLAVYKPVGIVCTRAQSKGEQTVYDLVPDSRDLVIAGRLDKDSEGLVLLSNDGELTNKLTHPRYQHEKEYEVTTVKPLDAIMQQQLQRGVKLKEGTARVDHFVEVRPSRYRVVIHQGWNRQIRRMIAAVRNDVVKLKRVRMGKLEVGTLKPGECRVIHRSEVL